MMPNTADLPQWDLTPFYPSVEDEAFEASFKAVVEDTRDLAALFDRLHVGDDGVPSASPSPGEFDRVLQSFLDIRSRAYLVEAYLELMISADSRDAAAQARYSQLQPTSAALQLLLVRLTAWVGRLDLEPLLRGSAIARAHEFFLRRSQTRVQHMMTGKEEALASDLVLTASAAWERLHADLTSQLSVPVERDGVIGNYPMSAVRNMAEDPDRDVRRRAYDAELAAWHSVRLPLAAAINSIKGEVNVLAARRRWSSPLDAAIFEHAIDRAILEGMLEAVEESFPDFRRYLGAKARRLGLRQLAWYDLFAPIGAGSRTLDFPSAAAFIEERFSAFSPMMGETAVRAFRERWIDAGPRPGKVGGAFCSWMRGDESRVLANFLATHQGMSTLAHELGHAYHNRARSHRSILQRRTPSTLAETASIFCETLVDEAAYEQAPESERAVILEAFLQTACAIVVDVVGRFYFEQEVFERRTTRELSPDELCEAMRRAQAASYGDGVDPATYHPYMWAVKSHYYSGSASFYNYPYTFGLLFGLGLFSIYREHPQGFAERYEDLLSRTGMATAADLAAGFGLDLRDPAFWRSSLDLIRERIARFEALTSKPST
jgi:oligoendopeptidase F